MSVSAKRRTLKTLLRDTSGAAALEFALVFPVFIALMFSIFQFGWAQHKLSSIRYAMEAASRSWVLDPDLTEAQIEAIVLAKLDTLADDNITIDMAQETVDGGLIYKLTGSYTTEIGVPFLATYDVDWSTTVSTAAPTS